MADKRAIGVFDSGLGGLTVVKEIMRVLPNENIVYFGDTGRVPYGTKSRETIIKYAKQDEKFLLSQDVKIIVAACGTVSSVAFETADAIPVEFVEVVSHSVEDALRATKNRKIGILATAATIKSSAHKKLILKKLSDAKVVEVAGTLLVSLVEEGWTNPDDAVTRETVRRYLAPMIEAGVDTVILGCTHFPLLQKTVEMIMGEGVSIINMAVSTADYVAAALKRDNALNTSCQSKSVKFFVSDKPVTFQKTASALLGQNIDEGEISTVDVSEL